MPDVDMKPGPDRTGFTRTEYDINGVKTVVQSIGSGPVLVFLHGTGTFTGFEVARAWAAHHTVLIPFHAGFGDSGDSDAIDTVEDHVLHYMDLFDRLDLAEFRPRRILAGRMARRRIRHSPAAAGAPARAGRPRRPRGRCRARAGPVRHRPTGTAGLSRP